MSVHRAGGSGLRDEVLHLPIRGASCTGRARARRLDGLSFFGDQLSRQDRITRLRQKPRVVKVLRLSCDYRRVGFDLRADRVPASVLILGRNGTMQRVGQPPHWPTPEDSPRTSGNSAGQQITTAWS
jgi:hypothetical protein